MGVKVGDVVAIAVKARSGELWGRRALLWHIHLELLVDVAGEVGLHHGRQLRRTLVDVDTGEVLDDVWIDDDGRVRSSQGLAGGNRARAPERESTARGTRHAGTVLPATATEAGTSGESSTPAPARSVGRARRRRRAWTDRWAA